LRHNTSIEPERQNGFALRIGAASVYLFIGLFIGLAAAVGAMAMGSQNESTNPLAQP
jgi:hypothetical protein